jgi:hypothetical protein
MDYSNDTHHKHSLNKKKEQFVDIHEEKKAIIATFSPFDK